MNETTNKTNATKTTKKVTTKKVTTEKITPVENETKLNVKFDVEKFFKSYIECNTKHEIVNLCQSVGIYTTTKPTDTPNKNDLYVQLFDQSRLKLNNKSIQVWCNDDTAVELEKVFECKSDIVHDNARTKRLTLSKTTETLEKVFDWFSKHTLLYVSQLSTKTETKTTTVVVEK